MGSIYLTGFAMSAYGAPDNSRTPKPGIPLGTLWYPGPFNPNTTPPESIRTPTPSPVLTPANFIPSAPNYTQVQPVSSPPQPKKPLGTLWYPGPYIPRGELNTKEVSKSKKKPAEKLNSPTSLMPPFATYQSESMPALSRSKTNNTSSKFNSDVPIQLSADEMSFDEKTGEVIANGSVLIISGERRLEANSVTYSQKTEIVTAKGNIQLFQPKGEKIFGQHMEISGDLKDAVIKGIGVLLADKSRIAASSARRFNGNVTEMYNGVYSPCKLCDPDPTKPPLWQVKAVKVIHDKNKKTIEYRDAWLEIMGLPVAYTPYLSHPDPSVKRQSGFLVPSFGGSSDLGSVGRAPYFFDLGIHRDATVTALVTGEGSGGIAEFRQRFHKGKVDANGSIILGDDNYDIRGHINNSVSFNIDKTWRWGLDINRASDDTYLRRYGVISENKFGSNGSLNSRIYVEGFRKRNYFQARAFSFQGMQRTDDPDTDPLVLPLIDFNHLGRPDRFGGQTILDANFLAITREEGSNTKRASIRPGWQKLFNDPLGGVYRFSTAINADFYHVENLNREYVKNYNGFSGRIIPQVMLDWRLPFARNNGNTTHIVEPIAVAIFSPYGGNSNEIPNEDSRELEFDDTNVFSSNRFSGIDRVEGGPRFSYGLKWSAFNDKSESAEVFFGQSVRPKADDTFSKGSGLEEKFSDLVGRITISPSPYFNLLYRTRFDSDNFTPKRNEIGLNAGGDILRVETNYIFMEDQIDANFGGREEVSSSINSKFTRFWKGAISGVHDIATGDSRQFKASVTYENECLALNTNASRKFYKDRDLEPSDQISFKVVLKTLGSVNSDIYQK